MAQRHLPIFSETTINLSETNNKLRTIENQLKKTNSISFKDLNKFVELFSENLWNFEQKNTSNDLIEYGEQLLNALKTYKPLREDFIKFIDIISSFEIEHVDEVLINFFESAPVYNSPREESGSWPVIRFEIFKLIFHELFLYTIAVCIKNKNYKLAADLLHSKYYKKDKFSIKNEPESFVFLYCDHENLENYSSKVYNKITGFGDYIITNLSDSLKKEDVILADTLCYFISHLEKADSYNTWFPNTYLYGEKLSNTFFEKMTSEKYFEKVKILFNIKTKEELQEKLNFSKNNSKGRITYGRSGFKSIPLIHELIKPEMIAIYR